MEQIPPIAELDALGATALAKALAPLFEGAPLFAARLGLDRPFGSYGALLERARVVALAMPEAEQIALLDAHPRIGAPPATVSPLSFREQGYDRETRDQPSDSVGDPAARTDPAASAEEEPARQQLAIELERLNAAYESRFGFRFVIHVAGRSRADIARVMEELLSAEGQDEKRRALNDVVNIAQDRLVRLRAAEAAG
ncbi:MAG: 2-oxo-4-hydroxy-4-carboxy-5-ureidoimidazoline decarboxylase [Chloroflexi bacterium]|nr:2-oxo-4-hydroxy-4-carboxy-5-ureidoimidazoline decarboxylase [Chloroflexota bacterium]